MRACLLATALARRMRLAEDDIADVYYATLLQHLGCTAYAHEEALLFGGDEIAARLLVERRDLARPGEALSFLLADLARDRPPWVRAAVVAGALARLPGAARELFVSPCEVAAGMAKRVGRASAVPVIAPPRGSRRPSGHDPGAPAPTCPHACRGRGGAGPRGGSASSGRRGRPRRAGDRRPGVPPRALADFLAGGAE